MNSAEHILQLIESTGVVAIIRKSQPFDGSALARALASGGVRVMEITLNSHNALGEVEAVRRLELPGLVVGAGTVRNASDARRAVDAGAQFLVAPNFDRGAVDVAHAAGIVMVPGVATPTEAVAAWEAGCRLLKFFPAVALGSTYLKLMRDPLDDVKFMATGGIDVTNLKEYYAAGAVAVGLGGSLIGKGDTTPESVTEQTRQVMQAIAEARHG